MLRTGTDAYNYIHYLNHGCIGCADMDRNGAIGKARSCPRFLNKAFVVSIWGCYPAGEPYKGFMMVLHGGWQSKNSHFCGNEQQASAMQNWSHGGYFERQYYTADCLHFFSACHGWNHTTKTLPPEGALKAKAAQADHQVYRHSYIFTALNCPLPIPCLIFKACMELYCMASRTLPGSTSACENINYWHHVMASESAWESNSKSLKNANGKEVQILVFSSKFQIFLMLLVATQTVCDIMCKLLSCSKKLFCFSILLIVHIIPNQSFLGFLKAILLYLSLLALKSPDWP